MALAGGLPGLPLSLQDMCMVHLALRLEEFSLHSLALLPNKIKLRLFQGLSAADHLHLEGTTAALFGECDDGTEKNHRPDTNELRKNLVDVLLYGCRGYRSSLAAFLSIDLETILGRDANSLAREDYVHVLSKHIYECYSSLAPFLTVLSEDMYDDTMLKTYLLPKRLRPFVVTYTMEQDGHQDIQLLSSQAWSLLRYCNMQSAPSYLNINCFGFINSTFWNEFDQSISSWSDQAAMMLAVGDGSDTEMNLVIPFIQEFLRGVEVLELATCGGGTSPDDLNANSTTSYVLLYNVLTSKQPCLKHLKITGIPWVADRVLQMAEKLMQGATQSFSSYLTHGGATIRSVPLTPLPPSPNSYLLEGFSIGAGNGYGIFRSYMTSNHASSIALSTQALVNRHMQKLKHIEIGELGLNYFFHIPGKTLFIPEYRKLFLVLMDLLKQPQFCQLHLGETPLPEGYEVIITFLCTPATHEQSLKIVAIRSERPESEMFEKEEDTEKEEDEEEEEDKEEKEEENIEEGEIEMVKNEEEKEEHRVYYMEQKENDTERVKKRPHETPDDPPTMGKRLCIVQEQKETLKDDEERNSNKHQKELEDDDCRAEMQDYMKPEPSFSPETTTEVCSSTIVAPSLSNMIFPETNIQFKCLDLTLSSDCVYSWLFTLPKLKLKKLRIGTHNINLVPAHAVIHVEHLSFRRCYNRVIHVEHLSVRTCYITEDNSFISQAHMEKFVVSNLALKQLEFEYTVPGLLPALNHCLSLLYRQDRGLEKLVLTIRIDPENVSDFFKFLAHVRDFSHRYGTTLVLSPGFDRDGFFKQVDSNLLADLSKEFKDKKITKITWNQPDWNTKRQDDPSIHLLSGLTDNLVVYCTK